MSLGPTSQARRGIAVPAASVSSWGSALGLDIQLYIHGTPRWRSAILRLRPEARDVSDGAQVILQRAVLPAEAVVVLLAQLAELQAGELSPGHLLGEKPGKHLRHWLPGRLADGRCHRLEGSGEKMAHSQEMCPLGLIVVLDKSVEEWIVHPDGCEIVEIRFHTEMLRTYLEQTPLASRMLMPRMA